MIAVAILSVGVLGFIMSFSQIAKAVKHAKSRTLAANPLTLEKLEVMRRIPYQKLMVSTVTATVNLGAAGTITYDTAAYPEETVVVGDISYTRRVYVEKVRQDGTTFVSVPANSDDQGMKRVTVYTIWKEEGEWKKYSASTLYVNSNLKPLRGTINGKVTDAALVPLANAQITVLQDPATTGITGSGGTYSFTVPAGTYTLRASLNGYFTSYSDTFAVPSGAIVSKDFTLSAMAKGTVTGTAWINDNLVITNVVVSTIPWYSTSTAVSAQHCDQEWIELLNPTTWTWSISNDAGLSDLIEVFVLKNGAGALTELALTYVSTAVEPGRSYLIANASSVIVESTVIAADAYYSLSCTENKLDCKTQASIPWCQGSGDGAGGAGIRFNASSSWIDRIAWKASGGGNVAALTEGTAYDVTNGMSPADQLVRRSKGGALDVVTYGQAYDTDVNSADLSAAIGPGYDNVPYPPRNRASGVRPIVGGTPAYGAVVSANDGLSSPVQAVSDGVVPASAKFTLLNVATGTWIVNLTSGTLFNSIASVDVLTDGVTRKIAGTVATGDATNPAGPCDAVDTCNVVQLSSTINASFISGRVRNVALVNLSGIVVRASGVTATTAADGTYTLTLDTGTHTVEANPSDAGGYNVTYVSVSSAGWNTTTGVIVSGVDFILSQGGSVRGRVTNNGTDPLSGIPVIASRNDVELGFASTDSNGYFNITGISTGTYAIVPQIDTGESVSPTKSVDVPDAAGATTVWSATFTLTGSPGTIAGTVKKNGVAIQTGVLLVATTGTITSDPPANNSTVRSGGLIYYTVSSLSDGTYSLEVRGGAGTYNIYAWYTTVSETGAVSTTRNTGTTTVAAGATSTVNFSW